MTARLYVTGLSNPSRAVAGMASRKRLPYRLVTLPAGLHPGLVRAAGFADRTVPALELADGRKLQGSLVISRALDELVPGPALFPADPAARTAVEQAERWGHDELQPIPRRIFRWAALHDSSLRRWVASEVGGLPAPGVVATLSRPLAQRLADDSGCAEESVRRDVGRLPELLDRVDSLIGRRTIGGREPNAADFQILASVRVLLDFEALVDITYDRPSDHAARRLYPRWEGDIPRFAVPRP